MSSCAEAAVPPAEQLCYIPCNFCNIVLAVSVPCNSLLDIVTVRCGHCSNLWSVNMAAATFHSLSTTWQHHHHHHLHHHPHHHPHLHQPNQQDLYQQAPNCSNNINTGEYKIDNMGSSSKFNYNNKAPLRTSLTSMNNNSIDDRVVNRPPEKRQRVPSAYNQFIKEEIQRIKANNPEITHREAFSTAAKNWAHFPHIHFGLMLETNNQANKIDEGSQQQLLPRTALLNN